MFELLTFKFTPPQEFLKLFPLILSLFPLILNLFPLILKVILSGLQLLLVKHRDPARFSELTLKIAYPRRQLRQHGFTDIRRHLE
jgi:hypothetical protein